MSPAKFQLVHPALSDYDYDAGVAEGCFILYRTADTLKALAAFSEFVADELHVLKAHLAHAMNAGTCHRWSSHACLSRPNYVVMYVGAALP